MLMRYSCFLIAVGARRRLGAATAWCGDGLVLSLYRIGIASEWLRGVDRVGLVRYRSLVSALGVRRGSVACWCGIDGLRAWCSEGIGRLLVRYRSLVSELGVQRGSIAEGIGRLLVRYRSLACCLLLVACCLLLVCLFRCFNRISLVDRSQVYR
jgi:hypothetical protein